MNSNMTNGFARHFITVLAGAVIVADPRSLEELVNVIIVNLANGSPSAIVASGITVLALIWSMWEKAAPETKKAVVQKLSIKHKE